MMATESPVPNTSLVPIVIGITGHRDIPPGDYPRLTESVKGELNDISEASPNSPYILLTGLAEGADRLAAEVALELGWRVGAVLPLPQEDYETDFVDEASVTEFRRLLARCAWIRVVTEAGTPRPQCYRVLGEWLARHAQRIIALWDGVSGNALGGTADAVKLFQEGLVSDRPILPDARPVIHILTRRERDVQAIAGDQVGQVRQCAPKPGGLEGSDEAKRWTEIFGRIDDFNRDALGAMQRLSEGMQTSRRYLCGNRDPEDSKMPAAALAASWLHAAADTLSSEAQKKRQRSFLVLIGLAVLAIFFEQLYSGPFPHPVWMALAIIVGVAGVLWYRVINQQKLESRYLDYRALAEACRVQHFWKRAGIPDSAADWYLREQRDELEWIRQAILATELGSGETDEMPLDDLRQVRDHWIKDQLSYFSGKPEKPGGKTTLNQSLDRRWSRRAFGLMLAGILLTVVVTLFHGFFAERMGEIGENIVQAMIVGYGMLFAAAGVCKVYQETSAFSEQANRYQRMGLGMQLALQQVDRALVAGDAPKARQALLAIGKEALSENGDWLLIHRDRPVQLPL